MAELKAFAFNGGGVWIALGPRADIEMFNQYVFAHSDGLSPLAIDGIVAEQNADSARRSMRHARASSDDVTGRP